ncbi:hypothetical protein BGZ83_002004 [Gryganskiella cystojenkinii]|nr:hypothetical protein BGZ83_002004 [Gryganskiella cystojenkinii]
MLSRVWTWFCGTRLGQRWDVTSYSYQGLDDGSISGNTHSAPFPPTSPYNGGSGTGNSGAGIYTSFTNMSSSSLSSLRLFNREVNEDEDDLESVWSTRSNLANAETMSIRSVRSVKSVRSISSTLSSIILGRTSSYAVPEMVSTTPSGRSRASSICSSEKS